MIFILGLVGIISTHRPLAVTYLNTPPFGWWGDSLAKGLGVPGYHQHGYDVVCLSFWLCGLGPVDIVKTWTQEIPIASLGSTGAEVRTAIFERYHNAGKKLYLSLFGATQKPGQSGLDATVCANKLNDFLDQFPFDGIDLDYQDTNAFVTGQAVPWLVTFTNLLKERHPDVQVAHAPQAPYFNQDMYNGGYCQVQRQAGHNIDHYLVQFYNQVTSTYDSYQTLFIQSNGWSHKTAMKEIIQGSCGIPAHKLLVGKPPTQADVYNTGIISAQNLGKWSKRFCEQTGWHAGIMTWQFKSDKDSVFANTAMSQLQTCSRISMQQMQQSITQAIGQPSQQEQEEQQQEEEITPQPISQKEQQIIQELQSMLEEIEQQIQELGQGWIACTEQQIVDNWWLDCANQNYCKAKSGVMFMTPCQLCMYDEDKVYQFA